MTLAALIFEGLVAALLVVAVVMCWRVDRRLSALKKGQDGVRESVIALNEATDRARASLGALERATAQSAEVLEKRVADARSWPTSCAWSPAMRTARPIISRSAARRAAAPPIFFRTGRAPASSMISRM